MRSRKSKEAVQHILRVFLKNCNISFASECCQPWAEVHSEQLSIRALRRELDTHKEDQCQRVPKFYHLLSALPLPMAREAYLCGFAWLVICSLIVHGFA
ncbi:hypothetical protein PoB_004638600 [Plakobranchus ocellatus]|uniref:Uncharacterized protein n=1 Tax=Plakobranchus ocellatus TaxID=259542 RepID=A0AAV4BHG1_9GAST|nr:hypothetical protein PoB_004638600 [Plakobranchus ocellatus]